MAQRITFYFQGEHILSLVDHRTQLPTGEWNDRYPSTIPDEVVSDILEANIQDAHSLVTVMMNQYGSPIQIVVADCETQVDRARVYTDTEMRVLMNPVALGLLREDPDTQADRSVDRPPRSPRNPNDDDLPNETGDGYPFPWFPVTEP